MLLKQGVRLHGIRPEIVLALQIAEKVYEKRTRSTEMVVTSVIDGRHSHGSLHYIGAAVDLRTRNIDGQTVNDIVADLMEALNNDYDVIRESNHIHIEYQPKQSY